MGALDSLENALDGVFGSKAPVKLPENVKKVIAEWLPWISLVLGILTLWSAYALYNWANTVNEVVDNLSRLYGVSSIIDDRMTAGLWVALIVLAVEGVLYLAAFPAIKARKKSGWNLLFYAALVNIVYAVVLLFTDYGGVGNFIFYLIGTAIGLWLLFQIRSVYVGGRSTAATPPAAS